jgi:hypothetical protein
MVKTQGLTIKYIKMPPGSPLDPLEAEIIRGFTTDDGK